MSILRSAPSVSKRALWPKAMLSVLQSPRNYSRSFDYNVAATRSTVVQLLGNIDSRTAEQYLSHFTTPATTPTQSFAVIKVSGRILRDHLHSLTSALAFFSRVGLYPVIVHGVDSQLNTMLDKAGMKPQFQDGIQVIPGDAMVLTRKASLEENLKLVQALEQIGVPARPLTSAVFQGEYLDRKKYHLVGRISNVNTTPILSAIRACCLPILTSMAETPEGQILKVNADLAAAELARALQPAKVVYLSEEGGLQSATGKKITRINLNEEYDDLMAQPWVRHDTRVKIQAAREILGIKTSSVSIIHPLDLQKDIFAHSRAGTRFELGTRIRSTTSVELKDLRRVEHALKLQEGADVEACLYEMRQRPFKIYHQDESMRGPLGIVSFGNDYLPRLLAFSSPDAVLSAHLDDMFTCITKDFPELMWTVREDDRRLDFFSSKATGRFHHDGWVLLWHGVSQQVVKELIHGAYDDEASDVGFGQVAAAS